jgi:hypothetical protein
MPVIPGTQQEEIKRISAKKLKNPISKKILITKKCWWSGSSVGPKLSSNPSTEKKKKKRKGNCDSLLQ